MGQNYLGVALAIFIFFILLLALATNKRPAKTTNTAKEDDNIIYAISEPVHKFDDLSDRPAVVTSAQGTLFPEPTAAEADLSDYLVERLNAIRPHIDKTDTEIAKLTGIPRGSVHTYRKKYFAPVA